MGSELHASEHWKLGVVLGSGTSWQEGCGGGWYQTQACVGPWPYFHGCSWSPCGAFGDRSRVWPGKWRWPSVWTKAPRGLSVSSWPPSLPTLSDRPAAPSKGFWTLHQSHKPKNYSQYRSPPAPSNVGIPTVSALTLSSKTSSRGAGGPDLGTWAWQGAAPRGCGGAVGTQDGGWAASHSWACSPSARWKQLPSSLRLRGSIGKRVRRPQDHSGISARRIPLTRGGVVWGRGRRHLLPSQEATQEAD